MGFGGISANDGYLTFGAFPVSGGMPFKILAGTYTFGSNASFNPTLTGRNFTGDVFLIQTTGVRLSDNVSLVPEPSAALLGALGSLALLRRRRA